MLKAKSIIYLSLSFITAIVFSLSSCGEDFRNSGIEGQWQLKEIEYTDGSKQQVDTIFYSFKKKVFRYLILKTDSKTFLCYGNYVISGDELKIDLDRDSFEPRDDDDSLDWDSLVRNFIIKKQNSSTLILEHEGDTYYFRKY